MPATLFIISDQNVLQFITLILSHIVTQTYLNKTGSYTLFKVVSHYNLSVLFMSVTV